MGENLDVVWAKFSTLSWSVLLITLKLCSMQKATPKNENLAQVLSCQLKFAHAVVNFYANGQVKEIIKEYNFINKN